MTGRLQSLALVLMVAAMGTGTAAGPEPERKPAEPAKLNLKFQALDANRDGMISRHEAHGDEDMERQFQSLDRDADGDVSVSEFAAFEVVPPQWRKEPGDLD